MASLGSKNTTFAGNKTYDWISRDYGNLDIDGSNNDDKLTFHRLDNSVFASASVSIEVDLKLGVDTVDYSGNTERAYVQASGDHGADYEVVIDGGEEEFQNAFDTNIQRLHVYYNNVEVFKMTNEDDIIDMTGATGIFDFYGEGGDDTFYGGNYSIDFFGGSGDDTMITGSGGGTMDGGTGRDTIYGGTGDDIITGGADMDVFIFEDDGSDDVITDFEVGEVIKIEGIDPSEIDVTYKSWLGGTELAYGASTLFLQGVDGETSLNLADAGFGTEVTRNGAGSGDTVICTLMHARGYISEDVYRWDAIYGARLGPRVLAGYHVWAIPLVERVLKRSDIAVQILRPLARAWALEMAHRCDPASHPKGSAIGGLLLAFGVPICRTIGTVLQLFENFENNRISGT